MDLYDLTEMLVSTELLTPFHLLCFPLLMEVLTTTGSISKAVVLQNRYLWASARFPALEARCEYWSGSLSIAQGDYFSAIRTWRAGIEKAVRTGCGYEEALCKMRIVVCTLPLINIPNVDAPCIAIVV